MKLEPLMTYHADLLPAVMVGAGPQGTRAIFEVTGGAFEGPRLRGKLLTGGGDWMLIDAQGMGVSLHLVPRLLRHCVPPWARPWNPDKVGFLQAMTWIPQYALFFLGIIL